jgi:hypothetical protein
MLETTTGINIRLQLKQSDSALACTFLLSFVFLVSVLSIDSNALGQIRGSFHEPPHTSDVAFEQLGRQAGNKENRLFDIKTVTDQNPEMVQHILGEPSELRTGTLRARDGRNYTTQEAKYKGGTVEITFVENGARYITVFVSDCAEYQRLNETMKKCVKERPTGYGWYPYPKGASSLLGDLGLDRNATAEISNQVITRWRNVSGIYEISIFHLINHISYMYILTNRRYEE